MTKHKASILTFCNNNGPVNYGQILQGYAVQKILEENGYAPEIVLYQKLKILELMTKRVRRFYDFVNKYMHTSKTCMTEGEVEEAVIDAELIVGGSDQVWFPYTIDNVWTLGVGKDNAKRISLAASGVFYDDEFTNEQISAFKDNFNRMDYISVREKSAKTVIEKYTDKDIDVLPDPTLFLDKSKWDRVSADMSADDDYIFCYCLGGVRPYDLVFKKLSEIYGNIKIKYIASNLEEDNCYSNMEGIYDAGPAEFISYIKNAKAIVTDSFHGVTLSIIFGKDWYNLERLSAGKDRFGGRIRVDSLTENIPGDCGWICNVKDVENRYEFLRTVDYSNLFANVKKAEEIIRLKLS